MKITLKDFVKIFRSDKVSENLVNVLKQETRSYTSQQQQIATKKLLNQGNSPKNKSPRINNPPNKRAKHPDFVSP